MIPAAPVTRTGPPADELLRCAEVLHADVRDAAADSGAFALHLDLALVDLEFGRVLGEPSQAVARRSFERALDLVRVGRAVPPWLYGGAAQAGWTAVQLARAAGVATVGLAPLDDVVGRWIAEFPPDRDVDLPRGLLGLGVYGLVHPDRRTRERFSTGVLDVVEARAEHDGDGLFVRLAGSAQRRSDGSAGAAVLGAAHGAAGLVSYLASVSAAGLACSARALALLAAAVRWLLRQRDPGGSTPAQWRGTGYAPSRTTWCYGNPGISLALGVAGEVTGSAAITAAAAELAAAAVARRPADTGVVDACVCHGAAGLVWFGRRVLDDPRTAPDDRRRAERFTAHWAASVVEQRAAGPLQYWRGVDTARNPTFLEGDAGVALALLHAATGTRGAWEQLLLGTVVPGPGTVVPGPRRA